MIGLGAVACTAPALAAAHWVSAGVTGPGNAGTFAEYITRGYFSLVALNFADTTALDHQIRIDLKHNPRYHLIEVIPYGTGTYVLWRYEARP